MQAIDKLRDTASSHQRAFLIETMGRLALASGVITGSEMVLIPEQDTTLEDIATYVNEAYTRGRRIVLLLQPKERNSSVSMRLDSKLE